MSLAEKWKEYRNKYHTETGIWLGDLGKRAFYAGAEALWENCGLDSAERQIYKAEIDHFRSHK